MINKEPYFLRPHSIGDVMSVWHITVRLPKQIHMDLAELIIFLNNYDFETKTRKEKWSDDWFNYYSPRSKQIDGEKSPEDVFEAVSKVFVEDMGIAKVPKYCSKF